MDVTWQNLLLIGAVVVFAGFLLWKYRPGWPLLRGSRPLTAGKKRQWADIEVEVRENRAQARRAKTPRERASALVRAADAAGRGDHAVASMGLYLRAMRSDATFDEPIRGIVELLRKDRPEVLESVLWRRLAHLPWSGETAPAARCAAEALVALYRHELRHRERARALRKLASLIDAG